MREVGLTPTVLDQVFPTWISPTIASPTLCSPLARRLLGCVVLRSESYGRHMEDPTRVLLPLMQADRLEDFAAGWIALGARSADEAHVDPFGGGAIREYGRFGNWALNAAADTQVAAIGDGPSTNVELGLTSRLLSDLLVDACVQRNLPQIRALLGLRGLGEGGCSLRLGTRRGTGGWCFRQCPRHRQCVAGTDQPGGPGTRRSGSRSHSLSSSH